MIGIADTEYILSVVSDTEPLHTVCVDVHDRMSRVYLPQSVLTESAYMITREEGDRTTAEWLKGLRFSKYQVIALEDNDIERAADLLKQYADAELDFVDATIIAIAERLNITTVLTIDRRDFSMIRPSHATHFDLLPDKLR